MNLKDLKLIGVCLYKCEGTKLRRDKRHPNTVYYSIDFTNSDPVLIGLFLSFMRKVLKVREEKIRIFLHLYEDLDIDKVVAFWASYLKIPISQFYKPVIIRQKRSIYKPNLLGTCKVRYIDKATYLRLDEIIKDALGSEAGLINQEKKEIFI